MSQRITADRKKYEKNFKQFSCYGSQPLLDVRLKTVSKKSFHICMLRKKKSAAAVLVRIKIKKKTLKKKMGAEEKPVSSTNPDFLVLAMTTTTTTTKASPKIWRFGQGESLHPYPHPIPFHTFFTSEIFSSSDKKFVFFNHFHQHNRHKRSSVKSLEKYNTNEDGVTLYILEIKKTTNGGSTLILCGLSKYKK